MTNVIVTWVKTFNHVLHEFLLFVLCNTIRIHAFCLGILFHLIVDDIFCYLKQRKSTSLKGNGRFTPSNFLFFLHDANQITVTLTSLIDPCPQIVIEGKSILDIGLLVVLRFVTVGSACHVS